MPCTARAGARMVDFGGWEMPVNYGSQIEEHHAVRRDAGMFDVSHMRVVDVAGGSARAIPARRAREQRRQAQGIRASALYSCLLAEEGGVQDDLIVYFLREDLFRLVVNAATAEKDVAWLAALAGERAPGLSLVRAPDLAMIAVQGPRARAKTWQAFPGTEVATAALKPFSAATVGERCSLRARATRARTASRS